MEDHTCLDFQPPSIFILSEKMVSATIIAIKISVAFALNVYCFFQWSLDFEVYNIGNCYLAIKLNHFLQHNNKTERDYALYNKQYVHLVWEQESNLYEPFLLYLCTLSLQTQASEVHTIYETVNLFKCWLVGIIVSKKFWIYLFCKSFPRAII